ncbi:MAG TPA: DUF2892 domain-containing protein [Gemmatimonadaceae bacterium]|nr:DUF2892 domain-containing protein [Gemmatimonadaceae bacterium]
MLMKNEGTVDRLLRVVAGVAILAFVPVTPWAWLGVVPVLTGAIGYCPLYHVLGLSTLRKTTTA